MLEASCCCRKKHQFGEGDTPSRDKLQWRDVTNSLGEHFKNLHKHCKVEEEICVSSPISKAVQRKYTRIRCDVECSLRRQDVRG